MNKQLFSRLSGIIQSFLNESFSSIFICSMSN
nr:MAG TPA: hypothetical protein [Caudoviricetes sp.]